MHIHFVSVSFLHKIMTHPPSQKNAIVITPRVLQGKPQVLETLHFHLETLQGKNEIKITSHMKKGLGFFIRHQL